MEGRWHNFIAACGLAAGLAGCHREADSVAWSYGDYDPRTPPAPRTLEGDLAITDPCLFRWRDTYWVFSTGPRIARHSSTDLVNFRAETPAFAQNPSWIAQTLPKTTDLWSPEVRVFGGLIHMYYAASAFFSGQSCIGHATTSNLDQPFQDQGPVICSGLGTTKEPFDSIDPTVIVDDDGKPWLGFGSGGDGIHLLALNADGARLDDRMITIAARPADNPAIQAAFLYHWRDHYYLFASFDGYNPAHALRVGRSEKVTGPYVDRDGHRLLDGGGTLLLSTDGHFKGPGSNSVLDDNGQRWNAYHAYDISRNNAAVLRIAPLFFDNDGWPVTAGP
jgi:arabinan endo-1,5-alpha-L-arabinosidase